MTSVFSAPQMKLEDLPSHAYEQIPEEIRHQFSTTRLMCSKESLETGKLRIYTYDGFNEREMALFSIGGAVQSDTGSSPGPDAADCFVATAVYGNIDAPEVQTLRDFRDNVLSNYKLGQKFIDFYYGGAGQKTASFIENKTPQLIKPIRKSLDKIVSWYENKK